MDTRNAVGVKPPNLKGRHVGRMKIVVSKYLVPTGITLLLLAVVLFFINPWAPLLLLASLLIQAPLIWLLVVSSYSNSYKDRTRERITAFEKDKDAQKWLAEEEKELKSIGRRYWSKGGENLSLLNRAQVYAALGNWEQAEALLAGVEEKRLSSMDLPRYKKLLEEKEKNQQKEN